MFQEHITAFTDGQISLRHDAFKDFILSKKISMLLKFYPGVKKINLDRDAGTLDITYDEKKLSKEDVMELLAQGDSWLKQAK